jgi:chromosome segregation ATPase
VEAEKSSLSAQLRQAQEMIEQMQMEKNRFMEEKNSALASIATLTSEKQQAIDTATQAVAEKDIALSTVTKLTNEKQTLLKEKSRQLETINEIISEKKDMQELLDTRADELSARITTLKNENESLQNKVADDHCLLLRMNAQLKNKDDNIKYIKEEFAAAMREHSNKEYQPKALVKEEEEKSNDTPFTLTVNTNIIHPDKTVSDDKYRICDGE